MTRRPRIIAPNLPNHLVCRGNNRRRLFSYRRDYLRFVGLIIKAHAQHGCELNAVALMANHVHLLQTPPSLLAASACMKSTLQRYAQIRNQERDASGKLFEQRYFSEPVTSERQLALTTCYIEANPIRAGLVSNALDYPYSTYALHAGEPERCELPRTAWRPSPWYRGLGRSATAREAAYRDFFSAYLSEGDVPDHFAPHIAIEESSERGYTKRLLRPDGSRAGEVPSPCTFARNNRAITGK